MTRENPLIPPLAARSIRRQPSLTGQARQDLIEETVKHVVKAIATSNPMDTASALSRLAILEGTSNNVTPEGEESHEEQE